jgi:hypothetical protein
MVNEPDELSPADSALLEQVANCCEYGRLHDLTEENLLSLVKKKGIDFATAFLYERVISSAEHRRAIEELRRSGNVSKPEFLAPDVTLAVAPGAFYLEYPETGADGLKIRSAAESLGCQAELIPTNSVGTLDENAELIVSWLLQHRGKRIILASLSKGGADIKVALRHARATEAFKDVVAWINVGGITNGSPIVTWIHSKRVPTLIAKLLFWWRGRNLQFLSDLDRRAKMPLDFTLRTPKHMKVIHVVGFPLKRHLSTKHSRIWHRRLIEYGPSDAATILIDSCKLPGVVFPIWGADHYSVDKVDWDKLTLSVLLYLEKELDPTDRPGIKKRVPAGVNHTQ